MNYSETLDYLYRQLPSFSRIGAPAYKTDLTNTLKLCAALGNPQQKLKAIHIAGTNGKGSVSHFLSAVFQTAGYKTGLYTSPHLKDFRERIRINGELCNKDFIVDFVARINDIMLEIKPSFFEITVAMAFEYFAEQKVDIAIIETGLGGRLDSTNVLMPQLSIITNIGWDHMNILGDTLDKIAFEKAGIIKPGVPVVIGEAVPETRPIFEKVAAERKAPLYFAQEERRVEQAVYHPEELDIKVKDSATGKNVDFRLDLPGIYQEQNLLTVLAATDIMEKKGWAISTQTVQQAASMVKKLTGLHGRWERVSTHPTVILDVGHNKSCMEQIARQLTITPYKALYIVCGFVRDKDIHSALRQLPVDAHYLYTNAHIPRALEADKLAEIGASLNRKGDCFPDVNTAIAAALQKAGADDLILVCGSFFVMAEVDLPIHHS